MPTVTRPSRGFDRSSLSAYIGAGAAIAFIAAMTLGAIDAPTDKSFWLADSGAYRQSEVVAIPPKNGESQVR